MDTHDLKEPVSFMLMSVQEEHTSNTVIKTHAGLHEIQGSMSAAVLLQEMLADRIAICELLDRLPRCSFCSRIPVTRIVVLPAQRLEELHLDASPRVLGICDDCEAPEDAATVEPFPMSVAVKRLLQLRHLWDNE